MMAMLALLFLRWETIGDAGPSDPAPPLKINMLKMRGMVPDRGATSVRQDLFFHLLSLMKYYLQKPIPYI